MPRAKVNSWCGHWREVPEAEKEAIRAKMRTQSTSTLCGATRRCGTTTGSSTAMCATVIFAHMRTITPAETPMAGGTTAVQLPVTSGPRGATSEAVMSATTSITTPVAHGARSLSSPPAVQPNFAVPSAVWPRTGMRRGTGLTRLGGLNPH